MRKFFAIFLVLLVSILSSSVIISCGDAGDSFQTNKAKAYISNLTIPTGGAFDTLTFDKLKFQYEVYTTGRPASCDMTVISDSDESLFINSNATTSGQSVSIPLSASADTIVSVRATKQNAQESVYTITFKHHERDARLATLKAYNSSGYLINFGTAFLPTIPTYDVSFYQQAMGISAKPANAGATLYIDNTLQSSSGVDLEMNFIEVGDWPKSVTVVSPDNTVTNSWTVVFKRRQYPHTETAAYTNVNTVYTVDGGIKKIRDQIITKTSNPWRYDVPEADRVIRGIVTSRNGYSKVGTPAEIADTYRKCFFIQDVNCGIGVLNASDNLNFTIGDEVEIKVNQISCFNYVMPFVLLDETTPVKILQNNVPIYYRTGTYSSGDAGSVFMWEGLASNPSPNQYGEGEFVGSLMYVTESRNDWIPLFFRNAQFYGPVFPYLSKARIAIYDPLQIKPLD